jgi:heptosyltransferase-3
VNAGKDAPSFLIVSLRYIGDVLLSTPLALSIKERFPDAAVDYLVFEGTEGILARNPHVRAIHAIPPGSRSLRRYAAIWKKYDYAIAANPSDRSAIHCSGAGRFSIGFSYFSRKEWWKKRFLDRCRFYDDSLHAVPLVLSQLEPLDIPLRPRVVMGYDDSDEEFARRALGDDPYILFHPYSGRKYKYWTSRAWGDLALLVRERMGLRAVVTVSPAPGDRAVLEEVLACSPPGTMPFPEVFALPRLAAAIRNGHGYVGVDTVATHMAAALDAPTVAIFGPTQVRHWGPWPNGSTEKAPYYGKGGVQRIGRIAVVQKDWSCAPCNRETCDLSAGGRIECLEAITPEEVYGELRLALAAAAKDQDAAGGPR